MTFRIALTLLVLAFIAGCAGASSATATPAPVGQFGFSDGLLIDQGVYGQLDDMASVLGSTTNSDPTTNTGSFFRGAFHWTPESVFGLFGGTTSEGTSYSKYDTAVLNAWNDGLIMLPEIHTSASGGGYIDPLTCTGHGCGTSTFEQAVEDIASRYGPGGAFAQAHPGFPGITRYEVWNEPNTNTGSLASSNTNDTPASEIDSILHAESVGLVNAATSGGWLGQLQIACCALGNPGNGNHAYSLAYFKSMVGVAGNTVWSDINPTGAQPGAITIHMYYGALNPTTCSDTGGDASSAEKCPKFLEDYWHPYIAAGPDPQDALGITEGGYSGPETCSASNTVSLQAQADDNKATIDYYRANPDINLAFLAYYKAYDTESAESGDCWHNGLGFIDDKGSSQSWKPWATTYNALVAADSSGGGTVAPTVTGASPNSGQPGDSIDVTGTGFTDATEVDFNGTSASFAVNSDTDLTATVPASATSGAITVTSPEGTGTETGTPFTVYPTAGASDLFSRTISGQWGKASEYGGPWTTVTGPGTDLSVGSGEGVINLSSATTTDTLALQSMGPIDSQLGGIDATLPSLPSANETIILESRVDANDDYYKASFQINSSGYVTITLRSHVTGTSDTTLATQTQFCRVQAGTPYHFELDATGLSPTSLNAGCYVATGTPKGITATDSTAALQDAGTLKVAVNPGASLTVPFETDFDNLSVVAP